MPPAHKLPLHKLGDSGTITQPIRNSTVKSMSKKSDPVLEDLFYVDESSIHGKGLFARKTIKKGSYMGSYAGPTAKRNGMYVLWVQQEGGEWVGCNGKNMLRYINHHHKPCAEFDGLALYALKNIKKHQEISIHYGDEFVEAITGE